MSEPIKIGQILIEHGVLSEQQVFEIIQTQKKSPAPFGVLAEKMFDVTIKSIEKAWIEQYLRFTGPIDMHHQRINIRALATINRRQAWQFEMLPLDFNEDGELLIAASKSRLARAVTFAAEQIDHAVYFRIAEDEVLRKFLQIHYPMSEVSDAMIEKAREMAHDNAA